MPYVLSFDVLNHESFNHHFWACFIYKQFEDLDFDTRVELNMFFTFVIVVA